MSDTVSDTKLDAESNETLTCKKMFGEVRGAEISDLVERTTGLPCPCRRDLPCVLLPAPVGASAPGA